MKVRQPRILPWLIVLILGTGMIHGCATGSGGKESSLIPITQIDSREVDGKIEVVINATEPLLTYTSYQVTEPLRCVIDITDADISKFTDKISVDKGAVLDILPGQLGNIARLEVGLAQAVDTKVYPEGGKLIVEIAKGVEEAKSQADVVNIPPAPAPVEATKTPEAAPEAAPVAAETAPPEVSKPATIVSRVKASAGKGGVKVVIAGNGSIVPNIIMYEGKKLIIDVPGAISKVRPNSFPVRKGGVDRVRIGQHRAPDKKVRIVLDLTRRMTYTTSPQGNKLLIAMAPAAPEAAKAASDEPDEAAAVHTEKTPEKETTAQAAPAEAPAVPEAQPVPAAAPVKKASRSNFTLIGGGKFSGRKISLDLQDADLVNVLRLFADVANLNVILAPDVKGKVTVRMVNIPWDQAMDMILKMNGLGYVFEDNVIRVATVGALTKEAEEETKAKEAKKKAEDLVTRVVTINYAKAKEVEPTIKKSLSARGETVVDERSNTIILKDIARNVDDIISLVKVLDRPNPQVMIESRIVEAISTFSRDIGVQWGGKGSMDAAHGNPTGFAFPNSVGVTGGPDMPNTASGSGSYLVNLPITSAGSGGAIGIQFGSLSKALNLDLVLSALESTGEGKIISSPRVSALDNKEATVKQGLSIPYLTVSASGTQIQFIDAVIQLIVTPHVTPDNKIFMKIKATKNAPDDTIVVNGSPAIRKNEAETEILLSDGETAVIGGILTLDQNTQLEKVPFFGDIPILGWFFKKDKANDVKRELIIFITPRIIKPEV